MSENFHSNIWTMVLRPSTQWGSFCLRSRSASRVTRAAAARAGSSSRRARMASRRESPNRADGDPFWACPGRMPLIYNVPRPPPRNEVCASRCGVGAPPASPPRPPPSSPLFSALPCHASPCPRTAAPTAPRVIVMLKWKHKHEYNHVLWK
ncbi:Protein of unknown function [Gryllus bimaculatus]|nr:Protein of unknown function [Gryllus bimaculatus]